MEIVPGSGDVFCIDRSLWRQEIPLVSGDLFGVSIGKNFPFGTKKEAF